MTRHDASRAWATRAPTRFMGPAAHGSTTLQTILIGLLMAAVGTLATSARAKDDAPALQLVETFPIETTLDNPDLPEAHDVWLEMIQSAERTLDFAEFYASNAPGSRLETIVGAIESAAARGVRVRFLAEENFYETYPETLERLSSTPGIEMRRFRVRDLMGGVLHAKYFIVDGDEAFVGSQNFDWRALAHIQELGVRIRGRSIVQPFADVFETDWALAGGAEHSARTRPASGSYATPVRTRYAESDAHVTPVFSPQGWLPDEALWDLPRLVEMIDAASKTVRVQLLTYRAVGRDRTYFERLESALRRAAARGVHVELLLSDWSKRRFSILGLQSLQALPNIDVKLMVIPEWSGGFIPYARVIHAKYLVVDGQRCWLGTSNWEKSYFFTSRNVGLVVENQAFAARLDRYFENGWNSAYAERVDPCKEYEPPRIAD